MTDHTEASYRKGLRHGYEDRDGQVLGILVEPRSDAEKLAAIRRIVAPAEPVTL